MATYRVTGPDGSVYEVNAPEGASDADVMAYVQRNAGMQRQTPKAAPATPKGGFADYASGVARGVADFDPAGAMVNLGTRATDAIGLTDGLNAKIRNVMNAGDKPSQMRSGGRVVGQMMGGVPLAAAVPAVGYGVGSATAGAINGALTSQAKTGADFATDVGVSAALGPAGEVAGKGLGRMVSANVRPAVKALADKGIPLTPGQILGGSWQTAEDTLTSLPLVRRLVGSARDRGQEAFNRTAVNEALAPIGVSLPMSIPTGHKAMQFVKETFKKGYDGVLGQMKVAPDADFTSALTTLQSKAATMSGDAAKQFKAFLDLEVVPKFQGGEMDGAGLKLLERELRKRISRASKSTSGVDQDLGDLFSGLRAAIRDGATRTSGPQLSRALDALDSAYANHIPLRDAASKTADGTFSPVGLDTSVRVSDRSVGKGAKATGQARMQDLSSNAREVMPSRLGNSGTADRIGAGLLMTGQIPAGIVNPWSLTVPPLLSLAYTKAGQKAAQAALLRGQGPKATAVKNLLERGGRVASGVTVPALLARPQ